MFIKGNKLYSRFEFRNVLIIDRDNKEEQLENNKRFTDEIQLDNQ